MKEIRLDATISVPNPDGTTRIADVHLRRNQAGKTYGTLNDPNLYPPLTLLGFTPWLVLSQLYEERSYQEIGDMLEISARTAESNARTGAKTVQGAYRRQFSQPYIREAIDELEKRGLFAPEVIAQIEYNQKRLRALGEQQSAPEKDNQ